MVVLQKSRFLAERLEQLIRLGLVMPPEYGGLKKPVPLLTVEQAAHDIECPIMDLPDGRTLYVIWLSLVAESPGTRLDCYRIEPPWPDSNFETLPRFEDSHVGEYYKLPGGLEFPRGRHPELQFCEVGLATAGEPCRRVAVCGQHHAHPRRIQARSHDPVNSDGAFF